MGSEGKPHTAGRLPPAPGRLRGRGSRGPWLGEAGAALPSAAGLAGLPRCLRAVAWGWALTLAEAIVDGTVFVRYNK